VRAAVVGWVVSALGAAASLAVACGARTGLPVPDVERDASIDAAPGADALFDVVPECSPATYCDQSDPAHVYSCGRAVQQCGLLEQCEAREDSAACVNPCLDSLGNDTSNGCEFYAVEMDVTEEAAGVCYAVFVVNQWRTGEPAKIQVDLGGKVLPIDQFARIPVGKGTGITYAPFDTETGLPANQIAILFLSRDPTHAGDPNPATSDPAVLANCPPGITPAIVGDAALHGTGVGTAFHIRTNVPVVAYQMLPYGGGSARVTGATLLVPTSAWDSNYVIADAYAAPSVLIGDQGKEKRAGPTTVVIAEQDLTHVTIKPTSAILGAGSIAGTAAKVPATYTLNQGQYLQFTQVAELTGSAVQADAPVSVIGGSTLMDIPLNVLRADSAEQMLPPVRALGSEYVAVRYRNRGATEESVPWRIVGVVDGTQLTYDPPQPNAPTAVDAQQLVEFDAPGPFRVLSQSDGEHPFYMAAYMTGGCGTPAVDGGVLGTICPPGLDPPYETGPLDGNGDPEFLNIVPPPQYLPRYTFFTDPTYPETNLVVVRVRNPQTGLMPNVVLDCAGTLAGWTPVGSNGVYEMTRVDLSTGDFQGVGGCDNGVHTITATIPGAPTAGSGAPVPQIGVTVWGWGNGITWRPDNQDVDESNPLFTRWVSYGYPAGANFQAINNVVLSAH
jgi:hypothetical protein